MVTVSVSVAVLPCESVAVSVTTVSPRGNTSGTSSPTSTSPSTKSDAVIEAPNSSSADAGVPLASTAAKVASITPLNTGAVVSTTSTWASAVASLLLESLIEKVTVVLPRGKVLGASVVTDELISPSTLSEADAPKRNPAIVALEAKAPSGPVASTVIDAGAEISGKTSSGLTANE